MSTQTPAAPDAVLKPRDLGQILDQNFKVFGRSWRSLLPVGLIAAIPGLLMSILMLWLSPDLAAGSFDNPLIRMLAAAEWGDYSGLIALGWGVAVFVIVLLLLFPLYQGALIDVSARAVLHMEPVPLSESFRVGAIRYWPMLGAYVLLALLWIGAIPALILAGLVVLSWITLPLGLVALATFTVFTGHAVIIEQLGPAGALKRSFSLVKTRFWPLLGTGIVYYLLSTVVSYIVAFPFSFVAGIAAAATESFVPFALTSLMEGLVGAIITPFMAVGLTLVYFDTRIRTEGYDLEVMAAQQAVAADPAEFQP